MKAIINTAAGVYECGDAPAPAPQKGELLISVAACGVCGSDLHDTSSFWGRRIPGHEAAGTVTAVGEAVDPSWIGKHIVVDPIIRCGECEYCRAGHDNLCPRFRVIGCGGNPAIPGGFAQEMTLPAANAIDLGATDIAASPAVVLADSLGVAIHALDLASLDHVRHAVVFGLGAVGVAAAMLLKDVGKTVTTVDIAPQKLQLADRLGLKAVNAQDRDAIGSLRGVVELAVEAAGGRSTAFDDALRLLRRGGTLLAIAQRPSFELAYSTMLFGEIKVQGVFGQTRAGVHQAAKLIVDGFAADLPLAEYPLEGFNDALQAARQAQAVKVVIRPGL